MDTPRGPVQVGLAMVVGMVIVAGIALVFVVRAPTAATPERLQIPSASTEEMPFSIAPFDRVCRKYVDKYGLVDYAALKRDTADLDAFLQQLTEISPHTNIATFNTAHQALAYWINAYNAWMMKAVTDAYPTDSVKSISADPDVFDTTGRICGGEDLSLNRIENEIVRVEFLEPRAHFALNCASMGCPWLPQEAFDPKRLDEQLDREARRFFADPTHFRVDAETKTVWLSSILDWYGEDFLKWLAETRGIESPTVLDFAKLYAPHDAVAAIGGDFTVAFLDYDWRLNDANAPWAADRKGAATVASRD